MAETKLQEILSALIKGGDPLVNWVHALLVDLGHVAKPQNEEPPAPLVYSADGAAPRAASAAGEILAVSPNGESVTNPATQ